MALGYFAAFVVSRYSRAGFSVPLVWLVANIPDFDVFLGAFIVHRGLLHSVLLASAVFVPIFFCGRQGLPYFVALLSHSLIGDYLTGPTQLFWPLGGWYGAPSGLVLVGVYQAVAEGLLILIMALFLWRSGWARRVNS